MRQNGDTLICQHIQLALQKKECLTSFSEWMKMTYAVGLHGSKFSHQGYPVQQCSVWFRNCSMQDGGWQWPLGLVGRVLQWQTSPAAILLPDSAPDKWSNTNAIRCRRHTHAYSHTHKHWLSRRICFLYFKISVYPKERLLGFTIWNIAVGPVYFITIYMYIHLAHSKVTDTLTINILQASRLHNLNRLMTICIRFTFHHNMQSSVSNTYITWLLSVPTSQRSVTKHTDWRPHPRSLHWTVRLQLMSHLKPSMRSVASIHLPST